MAANPSDPTSADEVESAGTAGTRASSETSREPVVSGDPLGLGGASDPDAPSRRPKPKVLALIGEFLKMSRTTAILLVAFVLVGALYIVVKDEPVVNWTPREPAETTEVETSTTSTGETGTPETTAPTSAAEETTSPNGATATTEVPTPQGDDEVVEPQATNPAPSGASSTVPEGTDTAGAAPTGTAAPTG